MPVKIDPANPQVNEIPILIALYNDTFQSGIPVLNEGEIYPLTFTDPVTKQINLITVQLDYSVMLSKVMQEDKKPKQKIRLFQDRGLLGAGNFGKGDPVSTSQKIRNQKLVTKNRNPDQSPKPLFVKIFNMNILAADGEVDNTRAEIQREYNLTPSWLKKGLIIDEEHNRAYMIMRRLPGIRLDQYLNGYRFNLQDRIRIAINLAEKVKQLHVENIIHRDLKPSNIMVDPETLEVNIFDFGLAKRAEEHHIVISGTPGYLSPEVLKGPRDNSHLQNFQNERFTLAMVVAEILRGITFTNSILIPNQLNHYDDFLVERFDNENSGSYHANESIRSRLHHALNQMISANSQTMPEIDFLIQELTFVDNELQKDIDPRLVAAEKKALAAKTKLSQLTNNETDLVTKVKTIVSDSIFSIEEIEEFQVYKKALGIKLFKDASNVSEIKRILDQLFNDLKINIQKLLDVEQRLQRMRDILIFNINSSLEIDKNKKILNDLEIILEEVNVLFDSEKKLNSNIDRLNYFTKKLQSALVQIEQEINDFNQAHPTLHQQAMTRLIDPENVSHTDKMILKKLYQREFKAGKTSITAQDVFFITQPYPQYIALMQTVILHPKKVGQRDTFIPLINGANAKITAKLHEYRDYAFADMIVQQAPQMTDADQVAIERYKQYVAKIKNKIELAKQKIASLEETINREHSQHQVSNYISYINEYEALLDKSKQYELTTASIDAMNQLFENKIDKIDNHFAKRQHLAYLIHESNALKFGMARTKPIDAILQYTFKEKINAIEHAFPKIAFDQLISSEVDELKTQLKAELDSQKTAIKLTMRGYLNNLITKCDEIRNKSNLAKADRILHERLMLELQSLRINILATPNENFHSEQVFQFTNQIDDFTFLIQHNEVFKKLSITLAIDHLDHSDTIRNKHDKAHDLKDRIFINLRRSIPKSSAKSHFGEDLESILKVLDQDLTEEKLTHKLDKRLSHMKGGFFTSNQIKQGVRAALKEHKKRKNP